MGCIDERSITLAKDDGVMVASVLVVGEWFLSEGVSGMLVELSMAGENQSISDQV
ncbi:hypothetical protein NHF46_09205 [Arthrobacter alpinus]|nr:hypothetical protein [Arthrobacter alpinus]